jgi:hypothetical protein
MSSGNVPAAAIDLTAGNPEEFLFAVFILHFFGRPCGAAQAAQVRVHLL